MSEQQSQDPGDLEWTWAQSPDTRRGLLTFSSVGNLMYCASRGKALLDKSLLGTHNWDLPAAVHVLFCGVSTRTIEKFWRLFEHLAGQYFRIEFLPLNGAR